jgi:two-component system heavy metal sensor histidine kinase CusS
MSSSGGEAASSARPPRRAARSITARLVALFTISSAALLGGVVGVFYRGVAAHLEDEHRHLLAEVVRLLSQTPPGQADAWSRSTKGPLGVAGHEGAKGGANYSLRILAPSGAVDFESPGMARVPAEAFAAVATTAASSRAIGIPWHTADGGHFLLATAVLQGGGAAKPAMVQVALDVTPDDELLAALSVRGAFLLLFGIVGSSIAGALVARHGLRPIERMAREMSSISARQLQRRLRRQDFPAELHRLVDALGGMLDRLDRSFAEISAYSGNLAHELRTPLGNLRGEAEVALLRGRTVEEYREVLASSLDELKRLSRMVDALLFLARAERHEAALARQRTSIGGEARTVVEFYAPLAEEKGVALAVSGDGGADLDVDLFRRALGNLVANALRAARRGGSVAVVARSADDGAAEVRVADDGCGIAESDLPHVFERFYRGSAASEPNAAGAGLGLAIVRSIVELHGGRVVIASVLGEGTEVTMVFPGRNEGRIA